MSVNLSISGSSVYGSYSNSRMPSPSPQNQALTDEQRTAMNRIISSYDADNFSKADFESMSAELKEAGIAPGSELKAALDEAGIDVSEYLEQPQEGQGPGGPGGPKGAGGPPPGPPPAKPDEDEDDEEDEEDEETATVTTVEDYVAKLLEEVDDLSESDTLADYLEKYNNNAVTEEDVSNAIDILRKTGLVNSGRVFDQMA